MVIGMRIIDYLLRLRTGLGYPGKGFIIAGLGILVPLLLMALLAPLVSPYDPTKGSRDTLQPPSLVHFFGTNNLGQDLFSRILWGGRVVLTVVLVSTILSAIVGVPLGLLSGYLGGRIDRALAMIMDSIYAFPGLILAIALASVLGPSIINAAAAIAVVYIPTYFRMTRGPTLQLKASQYVEAAIATGASTKRIIFRHILPNLAPTLTVVFTLNTADSILTEAGLSFLGFVVTPPTPDWGFDLKAGQPFLPAGYWWLITFPGIFIIFLSLGFGLLGEGLNELLSPKEKAM